MKFKSTKAISLTFGLFTFLMTLGQAVAQQRAIHTSHDFPFYSKLEPHLIHTDGEWAAIAFYRPPDCIRPDFNLLQFFDVPAAFGCVAPEPFVIGFGIWQGVPDGVDPVTSGLPPSYAELGLNPSQTMPIWFVTLEELQAAIGDGVMTIGELASLSSLQVGEATYYTEAIHPLGAANQTMSSIVTKGYLADGRSFFYTATESQGVMREVQILFKER